MYTSRNSYNILLLFLMLFTVTPTMNMKINNGADLLFPAYMEPDYHSETNKTVRSVPSIDFLQTISNYTVSDLLLNYVDNYQEDDPFLVSRFGEEVERSPAITPKPATCMPELQTVKLVEAYDASVIYLPSCTRIERCGGCCSHALLSCQPKETETVSFKVIKTQFSVGNRLKFVEKEVVHVEKHTKCACSCKIKEEDCNAFQEYRIGECRCVCTNLDEEEKCTRNKSMKLWDPDTCTCRCREISQCSSGSIFDGNKCRCVPIPLRRRFANADNGQKELESVPASVVYETSDYDP